MSGIADVTLATAEQLFSLGEEFKDFPNGKTYKYFKYSGAASAANGTVVYGLDATVGKVVDDISASTRNDVRGVSTMAVTRGYYAWFQTKGPHSAVKKTARDISDNSLLYGVSDGLITGLSTTATAATPLVFMGRATEATGGTSTTTAAMLDIDL